jgi:hypothetical protein
LDGGWDAPREKAEDGSSSESESGSDIDEKPKGGPKKAGGRRAAGSDDEGSDGGEVLETAFPIREFGKIEIRETAEEAVEPVNANRAAARNLKASELSTSENIPMSRRERYERERTNARLFSNEGYIDLHLQRGD